MSRGRVITLVGADGSGKTTVGQSLDARIVVPVTYVYMGSNPASATHMLPTTRAWIGFKRALGRQVHHSGPPSLEGRKRPARLSRRVLAHAKSLLRLGPHVAEDLYRFAVVGMARRRGHIVIADRHPVVDHLAADAAHKGDSASWRRLGDDLYALVRRRLYPRPGTVIHLDAPAEVLFARKPEGSLEALKARCAEYGALSEVLRDVVRVDATQPLDAVLGEVACLVERRKSPRPQLGLLKRTARRAAYMRTRLYYRTLDAANTAEVRSNGPASAYLRRSLKLRSSNFDRVGCASKSLAMVAPRLMGRARKALTKTSQLPLHGDLVGPFDYGTSMTCYHLIAGRRWVLKAFRDSIGQPTDRLLELARRWQANYDTLLRWYEEVPGLIPPTLHAVLRCPLRGAPAVAQIQLLVEGEVSDLLRDHDDAQIESMLVEDPRFHGLFVAFVRGARQAWEGERRTIDLIGAHNLMLYRAPEGLELRVVDMGIVDLDGRRRDDPAWCDEMLTILARMERLGRRAADQPNLSGQAG